VFASKAGSGGVDPEFMDYLFEDENRLQREDQAKREVREVLDRARAPVPAGSDLVETREILAAKLCRLLDNLAPEGRDRAARAALRTLEQLAIDQAVRVRTALASAIKDVACAPPTVINTLARDVERSVAEPILRYCAQLTDPDLLAIVAARGETWALSAVAARRRLSGLVSDALTERKDAVATGVLLDNEGAIIPEPTLERLIDGSVDHPEWQSRIARRTVLPPRLAVRLGALVDNSVLTILRERRDFDEATIREISSVARRRLDWVEDGDPDESPDQRAHRLFQHRRLDETAVGDAMSWGDTAFVRSAIALLARIPLTVAEGILASRDARAITALCWRAGLTMRCAMQIQTRASGIQPPHVLNARRGTDYPLTPVEMARALAPYGIPIGRP
jgi:uncharacterized protein (DUF2336 family)